jgi:hypothetical protein
MLNIRPMKKLILCIIGVVSLTGGSWAGNYINDPTLAFTNMGYIGDDAFNGSGWAINQDSSMTYPNGMGHWVVYNRVLENGASQEIWIESLNNGNRRGTPAITAIYMMYLTEVGDYASFGNGFTQYPYATNLILNPGITTSNYPGIWAHYLENPPPPQTEPSEGGAAGATIQDQAQELTQGLTFQDGVWVPTR